MNDTCYVWVTVRKSWRLRRITAGDVIHIHLFATEAEKRNKAADRTHRQRQTDRDRQTEHTDRDRQTEHTDRDRQILLCVNVPGSNDSLSV